MNFQRLIDGECGGSSPLEQLARHATQDIALQEIVNKPSTTVHEMPPQTFRMDELMREMDVIESERGVMPATVNQFPAANWTPEYQDISFLRNPPHYNTDYYNFEFPDQPAYYPNRLNQIQFEQATNEDVLELQEGTEESHEGRLHLSVKPGYEYVTIPSLDLLDNIMQESKINQFEDVETLEEAESVEGKGCSIKAEESMHKVETILNDPVMFNKFINAYPFECTPWREKRHKLSEAELLTSEYPFAVDNPMMGNNSAISDGLTGLGNGEYSTAVLCFEAALQNDPGVFLTWAWYLLCKALYRSNDSYKLLCATKQLFTLKSSDPLASVAVAKAYKLNDCPYQTCQSLFKWLKNEKIFCDVIPPNFEMEDKKTTELDVEVLNAVKFMFIKASERNPSNPDPSIQNCLAVLFSLSGEYDKAVDCQRLVDPYHGILYIKQEFDLGKYLFFANKPYEGINVFLKIAEHNYGYEEIDAYMKIGFILMYLRDYDNALEYFHKAHFLSFDDTLQIVDSWILACKNLSGR